MFQVERAWQKILKRKEKRFVVQKNGKDVVPYEYRGKAENTDEKESQKRIQKRGNITCPELTYGEGVIPGGTGGKDFIVNLDSHKFYMVSN